METTEKMQCALCGYTESGKFVGDICPQCNLTYWRCSNCQYTISAAKPPEVCPSLPTEKRFSQHHLLYPGVRWARRN